MKNNITSTKFKIKSDPWVLLRKPWLIFIIPVILFDVILRRLRKNSSTLFLTETLLSDLKLPENTEGIASNFDIVQNANDFLKYMKAHILENQITSEYYKIDIRKRFERGDFAIVYLGIDRNPLSYVFIAKNQAVFDQVGITLSLPENTFGLYDVYTFEKARGKGCYSHLFWFVMEYMKNQKYVKIWLWLMEQNKVSINVHMKLGLTHITKILTQSSSLGRVRKEIKEVKMKLSDLI